MLNIKSGPWWRWWRGEGKSSMGVWDTRLERKGKGEERHERKGDVWERPGKEDLRECDPSFPQSHSSNVTWGLGDWMSLWRGRLEHQGRPLRCSLFQHHVRDSTQSPKAPPWPSFRGPHYRRHIFSHPEFSFHRYLLRANYTVGTMLNSRDEAVN